MTFPLRAVLALSLLAPTAACTTVTQGSFEGIAGSVPTRVAFEGTLGVPDAMLPIVTAELQSAAQRRGLVLVGREDRSAAYVMRGFMAAAPGGLSYVFDVFDRTGGHALRLDGTAAGGGDVWTAENARAVREALTRGVDGVHRFVTTPRTPIAAPAPAPAPVAEPQARVADPEPRQAGVPDGPRAYLARIAGLDERGQAAVRQAMSRSLGSVGYRMADTPAQADLHISADATLNPPERGRQKLALIWNIDDARGVSIGEVRQFTMVPEGSLPQRWERTAATAAERTLPGMVALAPPRR